MSARLEAIRKRELWALSPTEQMRVLGHAGRIGVRIIRGKSPSKADRAMTKIWEDAEKRVKAEEK